MMMLTLRQVMYVFRECSKFTSVFTLCALSVDRFLATFHEPGHLDSDLDLDRALDFSFDLDVSSQRLITSSVTLTLMCP